MDKKIEQLMTFKKQPLLAILDSINELNDNIKAIEFPEIEKQEEVSISNPDDISNSISSSISELSDKISEYLLKIDESKTNVSELLNNRTEKDKKEFLRALKEISDNIPTIDVKDYTGAIKGIVEAINNKDINLEGIEKSINELSASINKELTFPEDLVEYGRLNVRLSEKDIKALGRAMSVTLTQDSGSVFTRNKAGETVNPATEDKQDAIIAKMPTLESNGGVPVNLQDQVTEAVDLYFNRHLGSVTLASDTSIDAKTLTFTAGHGIVVGNILCLREDGRYSQVRVLSVATNTITVDTPMEYAFTTSADIHRGSIAMNVNGATTSVIYQVSPPTGVKWDITRIMIHIEDDAAMDSAKFGGMSALTNGVVLRKKDGIYKNIFNVKTNAEFGERAYDIEYDPKAPAGVYGFRCRRTFAGQDKNGVAIRIDGTTNDELQVIIQDNLTNLSKFRIIAQGHVIQD